MSLRRSSRIKHIEDYSKFNTGGWNMAGLEQDYVDADLDGENDLLGSGKDSDSEDISEDEKEEGQISEDEETEIEGMDSSIMELAKKGQIARLRKILKAKQEEGTKLKKESRKGTRKRSTKKQGSPRFVNAN